MERLRSQQKEETGSMDTSASLPCGLSMILSPTTGSNCAEIRVVLHRLPAEIPVIPLRTSIGVKLRHRRVPPQVLYVVLFEFIDPHGLTLWPWVLRDFKPERFF